MGQYTCCRLCGIFSCDCPKDSPCRQPLQPELMWKQSPNSQRFYPKDVDKALKAYARHYRVESK